MISKEIKFLFTHSSIYGLGTVVSQIVAFILLPLYTRYLTPSDYGVLSTIEVSTGIIGIVVTVGIARALSRFYYEADEVDKRNRIVSTTYITFAIISLLCSPVLLYVSNPLSRILFSSDGYGHFFTISLITMLLGGLVDIGMMYLRLIKKPIVFITITITRLLFLILLNIFFIVHLQMGVLGILYSSLIVISLYALLITMIILKKTKMGFSFRVSRQLIEYGFPMIFSNLGSAMVKQSDKYFVLYLISVADMGIYSLALKLGNSIHNLLTIPFNMAYIPRRFEIMNRGDAKDTYSKIFTYYIFFVVYVGLALSILIPEILKFMVTPEFMRAKDIVPLVVFSMIIFGCHYHFDFGILHSKRTKYLAYISITCGIVQILLNIILIRKYSLFGAVWSSIIALTLQAVMLYSISQKLYHIEYEFRRIFIYLLVACLFYGVSLYLHTDFLLVDIVIKISLLVLFPVVIIILRIIPPKEKAKLMEIYTQKVKHPVLSKIGFKIA